MEDSLPNGLNNNMGQDAGTTSAPIGAPVQRESVGPSSLTNFNPSLNMQKQNRQKQSEDHLDSLEGGQNGVSYNMQKPQGLGSSEKKQEGDFDIKTLKKSTYGLIIGGVIGTVGGLTLGLIIGDLAFWGYGFALGAGAGFGLGYLQEMRKS